MIHYLTLIQNDMGRKVFISVLGTGFYEECTYVGKIDHKTRFIQKATLEEIDAGKWCRNDVAYILLTDSAKKTNWDKNIHNRKNNRNNEIVPYSGLEMVLSEMILPCRIVPIDIEDGKNESEMWDIFNTIYGLIEKDDELYFDLTHAFRYLPMLIMVLGNYSKFLKDTSIAYMSYGNYEARVKNENDSTEDRAPIVDLLPLSVLQDWTFAAGQFIRSGNVDEISAIGKRYCREIKKELKRSDPDTDNMSSYVASLNNAVQEISLCRGQDVINGNSIKKIREYQGKIKRETIPAMTPLIDRITESFAGFKSDKDVVNTYFAAKWCREKRLYQQSLTFLKEAVVSFICAKCGLASSDMSSRELVEDILYVKKELLDSEKGKASGLRINSPELVTRVGMVFNYPLFDDSDFLRAFSSLRDTRNDYNHSGMRENASTWKNLRSKVSESLDMMAKVFGDLPTINTTNVFINYSNHKSNDWSESQIKAARQYGEIIDVPFANIDPDLSCDRVLEIVDSEYEKIFNVASGKNATVHIMGEMTLTFALVKRLQAVGIKCVASTTERSVKEYGDGTKESVFKFVRFREYER